MKARLVCSWLFLSAMVFQFARAHPVGDEMAEAANGFLASLSADLKAKAAFTFQNEERLNWHFIPRERKGLPLKALSEEQRRRAHRLLTAGLSAQGYNKATNIMSLEVVLHELERPNGRMVRDAELYYFSIFGTPHPTNTWGWRIEGHHLAFNFTVVKGELFAGAPSFLGANPAEVPSGPRRGLRVLAAEEDLGRALLASLTEAQRKSAVLEIPVPKDIITGAERKVKPLERAGIASASLNEAQQTLLRRLVNEYAHRLRPQLAEADLAKIQQAGWNEVYFAWVGPAERGAGHYYRVQGPTFLIEYDNTQNDANHIHAVWRDFQNDFGEDILRRHHDESAHK